MAHLVKCYYCGKTFDRDKIPFIKVNARRYAHTNCSQEDMDPEKRDRDNFYKMVKSIYGSEYNFQLINQQANSYIEQYNYTWSGMTGCLHWFYNINHGNLEDSHGGIGIIPFIYEDCRKYYQNIYKAQERNKDIKEVRKPVFFNIQSPRAWQRPPHLLDLDQEGENEK